LVVEVAVVIEDLVIVVITDLIEVIVDQVSHPMEVEMVSVLTTMTTEDLQVRVQFQWNLAVEAAAAAAAAAMSSH